MMTSDNIFFVAKGNIVELSLEKLETLMPKFTHKAAKGCMIQTHTLIKRIEQGDIPDGILAIRNGLTAGDLLDMLYEGVEMFDEFFPNLSLEVENMILEDIALREIKSL